MSYVAPPQAQQVYLSSSRWSATFCFFTSSRKKHNNKFLKIRNLVYGSVAPPRDALQLRWIDGHKIDGKVQILLSIYKEQVFRIKDKYPRKDLIMVIFRLSFEIKKE